MPLECMNRGQWPRPKPEQKDFDRESYLYWSAAWEHDRAVAAETRLAAAEQMIRDNLGSQWLDLLKARAAPQPDDVRDAARLHWLLEDHATRSTRRRRDELLARMPVMSYSAAVRDIDIAMAECAFADCAGSAADSADAAQGDGNG